MTVLLYLTLFIGFLIVYHHAIYPVILKLIGRKTQKQGHLNEAGELPSIHIIVPAYNEQEYIARKIRNLNKLQYPTSLLRITIVGDGCSDNTMAIARQTAQELAGSGQHIEVEEHLENRGKVGVLNRAISESQSEIIALSDVSALLNETAMLSAANHFADSKIGVVNSVYRFDQYASAGERAYWDYQTAIKGFESNSGSVIGAHGALYFFRRKLFQVLSDDTINDDFIVPMQVVAQGYRAHQAQDIFATELEQVRQDNENSRRMRIAAGNLQQVVRLRKLLLPSFGGVAFNFFSGKCLRVLMPWCLLFFFVSSLVLSLQYPLFTVLALGQCAFYAIALWLHKASQSGNKAQRSALAVIYYFSAGHWFSLVGMYRYLTGSQTFKV